MKSSDDYFAPDLEIVNILKDDILAYVRETLDDWIVGEEKNKLTLFLSKLTYMTKEPTHEIIRGESGGGKTHLAQGVLEAFPPEDKISVSRVTPTWTNYTGKELKQKIIFVQQLGGADSSSESFHILMSEQGLRLGTVKMTGVGWDSDFKETEGPISFLSTTTNLEIDPQMETRTFSISPDESQDQTEAIQRQQAHFDAYPWEKEKARRSLMKIWKIIRFLRDTGVKDVVVPFSELVELPSEKIRVRRDRPKLIALVKSLVMLRQMNRRILDRGDERYIVAEWKDLVDVLEISGSIVSQTIKELTENEVRIIEKVNALFGASKFDAKQLAGHLSIVKSTVRKHLNSLYKKGYLNRSKGGGRSRKNLYDLDMKTFYAVSSSFISEMKEMDESTIQEHLDKWENSIGENVNWGRYDNLGKIVMS